MGGLCCQMTGHSVQLEANWLFVGEGQDGLQAACFLEHGCGEFSLLLRNKERYFHFTREPLVGTIDTSFVREESDVLLLVVERLAKDGMLEREDGVVLDALLFLLGDRTNLVDRVWMNIKGLQRLVELHLRGRARFGKVFVLP